MTDKSLETSQPPAAPPLRSPRAMIAGCMWLPRFADKVRLNALGRLPKEYSMLLANPRGIDGHFLRHFSLEKQAVITALGSASDDREVATWFLSHAAVTPESIQSWNKLAPTLGAPGKPGMRELQLAAKFFFKDAEIPQRIHTLFDLIEWDESLKDGHSIVHEISTPERRI